MPTTPTQAEWTTAWKFARAAPADRHSVRLLIDGIKNPGADVCVALVAGYVVLATWWTAWYPSDLPEMNCVFNAGPALRQILDFAQPLELRVEVRGEVGNAAEFGSARLELVTLPEVPQ